MSVSLLISVTKCMSLADVADMSRVALQEILNRRIALSASFDNRVRGGDPNDCLSVDGPLVICSTDRNAEAVRVMTFNVPIGKELPTGEWTFRSERVLASVECHSSRTPLCWAIVASVAVAIARASSSEIEDHSSFFTSECDGLHPDTFVQRLAVNDPHPNVESAAIDMYEKMNKSKELIEWLKSGS